MLHFDDIVFGPIFSRRLGSSLGVNLLPSKGKLCNFDCVYCECGWNKDGVAERVFPRLEEVKSALEEKMSKAASEGVPVDSITFSGNGEPTMNPDFPEIVDVTLELRDRFFPDAKVSVLSNATLIGRPAVAEALMRVDNPILKVDASSDSLIARINKPVGRYRLEEVIEAMMKFDGAFVLQTMFLKSEDFDSSSPEVLDGWKAIVRELRPRQIMVYTIDRPTPQQGLQKFSAEQMRELVADLIEEGFEISIKG